MRRWAAASPWGRRWTAASAPAAAGGRCRPALRWRRGSSRSGATAQQQAQQAGPAAAAAAGPAGGTEAAAPPPRAAAAPAADEDASEPRGHRYPEDGADARQAWDVLVSLSLYGPVSLSDGPATLAKVRPYSPAELQHALAHGGPLLGRLQLPQLANIAAAVAAAGHCDAAFMRDLGSEAARQLAAAPPPAERVTALGALRAVAWLAAGFARLGVRHTELLTEVAVRGAQLLQHRVLNLGKRKHAQQLALLAAAYAALRLRPPQLLDALCEHLKQHRHVLKLLGPQDVMLLLWALARMGHRDRGAQLLLTQRAATQVGQLDCQGLAHTYTQCAAAGLAAPPLLAALRKAVRLRCASMQPAQLTAVLTALAALQQQDLLLLDDLSRAIHNQLLNFSGPQISASLVACAALRYRNPWLLEHASKMLVSRRLTKAQQLGGAQLADLLVALHSLRYPNALLLGHLGSVAAAGLVPRLLPGELAAVAGGFAALRFWQPALLQAAAVRLQQLAEGIGAAPHAGRRQQLAALIDAACQLASMPAAGGGASERTVLPAALAALARQAGTAASAPPLVTAVSRASSSASSSASIADLARLSSALLLVGGCQPSNVDAHAAAEPGSSETQLVLRLLQQQLAVEDDAPGGLAAAAGPELLQLLQLLWLTEQQQQQQQQQQAASNQRRRRSSSSGSGGARESSSSQGLVQRQAWQLGLPAEALGACLHALAERQRAQLQRQLFGSAPSLLRSVADALGRLPGQQELQLGHAVADSPMLLPLAVLPAAAGGGGGGTSSSSVAGASRLQPEASPLYVAAEVPARRSRRGLQLPSVAQDLLAACAASATPLAVCVEPAVAQDDAAGSWPVPWPGSGWHTVSQPRQLLPAADVLVRGLLAAGWAVLLLREAAEGDPDAAET